MATPIRSTRPWYREPWPWILFGLPAIVVVAAVITLAIALRSDDGVVDEDYYKEGLGINKQLARAQGAAALGLSGRLRVEGGTVRLSLSSARGAELPQSLRLLVTHPTRSGSDQELLLERADDAYVGVLHPLPPGRWRFHLEDVERRWRLDAEAQLPAPEGIALDARLDSAQ